MRHEEGRRRDRDDVHEHLRPGGAEGDDLVEGVAREARRAAGLRVAHGALGVRGRGGGEDDAGDDEHERRQPERVDRGQAERVVDRRADVAVGGREERRRPENSFEPGLLPPPPGHCGTLDGVATGGGLSTCLRRVRERSELCINFIEAIRIRVGTRTRKMTICRRW